MRLLRLKIVSAATCGGLLDGLEIDFRGNKPGTCFSPMCLIGPNGAGKSQVLQVVAEIFQAVFHAFSPEKERRDGNPALQFALEYTHRTEQGGELIVKLFRTTEGKRNTGVRVHVWEDEAWLDISEDVSRVLELLPERIVGYTSGDNETLSLPFLISRSGYADEVGKRALSDERDTLGVPDTRLMLIDYATHLEVLVSNLLLGGAAGGEALLRDAGLQELHSFRCVVQLAPSSGPSSKPSRGKDKEARRGIRLTRELEEYIDRLKRCATSHHFEERNLVYTFDYWLNDATREAFRAFFDEAIELYAALHKLAMLNDLAIPKASRERFRRDTNARRFASRLPEPQDEDKVFRFERVSFTGAGQRGTVEYVSLSDGEHQLAQLLGTFSMFSLPNVLFLLDEPESHFNPQWRVNFLARISELPTKGGRRTEPEALVASQECVLTTHAPFVPSDMPRENVIIFGKEGDSICTHRPNFETFGTTFDAILEECFGVTPPISALPRATINELMESQDVTQIKLGLRRLGPSVEKIFLEDHLSTLEAKNN